MENFHCKPDSEQGQRPGVPPPSAGSVFRRATFDEVWGHLRQFMPDDFSTQQAIIVMDGFGWIDNGPCTCGLETYGDPCPHHSQNADSVDLCCDVSRWNDAGRRVAWREFEFCCECKSDIHSAMAYAYDLVGFDDTVKIEIREILCDGKYPEVKLPTITELISQNNKDSHE